MDSSPLWGAGRVEDTYNLIGHALKKVLHLIARGCEETVADVGHEAGAEMVYGPSLKAVLDRDWGQIEQREEALELGLQVLRLSQDFWRESLHEQGRPRSEYRQRFSQSTTDDQNTGERFYG